MTAVGKMKVKNVRQIAKRAKDVGKIDKKGWHDTIYQINGCFR